MGKDADRSSAQEAYSLDATPPAVREASARGVMEFLRGRGQIGYPPRVAAGAQLRYSAMEYQIHEILFGSCGGDGSIMVQREGFCARARIWGQKVN